MTSEFFAAVLAAVMFWGNSGRMCSKAWHGVYTDSRHQQSYSVYIAHGFEVQFLYASGRLYEVRWGQRRRDYDVTVSNFYLPSKELLFQEATVSNIKALFTSQVVLLGCEGAFVRTHPRTVFHGLEYDFLKSGSRDCDEVEVVKGNDPVYISYERTDINHVGVGVIVDP
jgi:hypothetical protein